MQSSFAECGFRVAGCAFWRCSDGGAPSLLMFMFRRFCAFVIGLSVSCLGIASKGATSPQLRVLFLGDSGHHRPAERFKQLQPVLTAKGMELVYTEDLA